MTRHPPHPLERPRFRPGPFGVCGRAEGRAAQVPPTVEEGGEVGLVAKVGGRNIWIAVPAGLLCVGVVGALAWLSQPILPATAAWMGDALRNATTHTAPTPEASRTPGFVSAVTSDCRALYPDDLWSELTWTRGVLLSQTTAAPATSAQAIVEALTPEVRVSCTWTADGGMSISTTVAAVSAEAAPIAEAAFIGAGFTCDSAAGLQCTRTEGSVLEEHILRDGLWISSVETAWHPEDYDARIATHLWG